MKLIPDAISRKVAQTGLAASANSPKILFVGGVVGMVGSTVLACRATLKLEATLDDIEREKAQQLEIKETVDAPDYAGELTYSDKELKRDLTRVSVKGIGKIARLYAPSVIVGGVSIAALTKSHNILQDRNLALTAAYAAIDGAYSRYRERVVERYGADVDRELYFESETVDIIDEDTGKLITTTRAVGAPGSIYARWYDEQASRNWKPDPDVNLLFLTNQQNWANDRLKVRGHVFLNEVYDALGLSHTKEGSVVGWLWHQGTGDNEIDFGIWDANGADVVNDFFNGREGAILLDFNVDGMIYDKLNETGR